MEKRIIEAQPSLVLAFNEKQGKLITAVYDAGYRRGKSPYILAPNIIGGNPDIKYLEKGPIDILYREVKEEYDPEFQSGKPFMAFGKEVNPAFQNQFGQRVVWATPRDIALVRDGLLDNLKPAQDFYVNAVQFAEGTADYKAIYSYFRSDVSDEVIGIVESNLRRQKTLTPEGLTGVFTLEELENDPRGKFSTAHITAPVLNYLFGTKISYPDEFLGVEAVGEPRETYRDYLNDFEYSKVKKPNHNEPEKMDPNFYEVIFGVGSQ